MCILVVAVFFFKQKTAYELRISDWSSDVCSSDLDIHAACGKVSGDSNVPPERPHPMRQARIEKHQRHGRRPGRCRGEDSVAEPWNVDHFIHWPSSGCAAAGRAAAPAPPARHREGG